jgi:hypothetical protein
MIWNQTTPGQRRPRHIRMVQGRISQVKIHAGDFLTGMPLLLIIHSLLSSHGVIYHQMSTCQPSQGRQSPRQPVKRAVLGDGMALQFHLLGRTATACPLEKAEEGHQIEGHRRVPFLPSRSILVGNHHKHPTRIINLRHLPLREIRPKYFRPHLTISLRRLSLTGDRINFNCRSLNIQGHRFD